MQLNVYPALVRRKEISDEEREREIDGQKKNLSENMLTGQQGLLITLREETQESIHIFAENGMDNEIGGIGFQGGGGNGRADNMGEIASL